jgi:Na+-driven multidrug efflux pump
MYLEVLPLVIIGYLLLFGDFITGIEVIKEGQEKRPDEIIDIDINRSHNSVGIRNALGAIINPFFPTQGALWTGVHVVVVERWKQGGEAMSSLYDGIHSYYLMGIPFLFFVVPFIDVMEPLMIVALGVTLILTGLACSYIAMSLATKNSEKAVSLITAVLIAFGGEYMWLGILIGLILSYALVDNNIENV